MSLVAFDTLGYAQHLRRGGVPADLTEVHSEAAREFIMRDLVTKPELDERLSALEERLGMRFELLEQKMDARFVAVDRQFDGVDRKFDEVRHLIARFDDRFTHFESTLALKMTTRLGAMMIAATGVVVAALRYM